MSRTKNCGRCNKPKVQCECGRPRVIDKFVLQKLEAAFANSFSDNEACLYAGISPATLYNYQKENPEFVERKEQLKLSPNLKAKQTLVGDLEQVDTAKWWAERKIKDEFGERKEITGKGGEPIKIIGMEIVKDEGNKNPISDEKSETNNS